MSNSYNNIDDLFREKFKNYEPEPPEHIWSNIISHPEISGSGNQSGNKGKNFGKGYLIGLTVLLIAIGILSSFLLTNRFTEKAIAEQDELLGGIPDNTAANTQDNISSLQKFSTRGVSLNTDRNNSEHSENRVVTHQENKKGKKHKNLKSKTQSFNPGLGSPIPLERTGKTSLLARPAALALGREIPDNKSVSPGINETQSISKEEQNEQPDHIAVRNSMDNTSVSGFKNDAFFDYGLTGQWTLGVLFSPELVRYPSDDNLNNYSYAVDIHALYRKNNFFIQSGVGLERVKDRGKYAVEYNKYMGSYEDVYDITFDSVGNEVVPTFLTQTVRVYDSVSHYKITQTNRHFNYLRIPLLFGYIREYPKFDWFVKTGPSVSMLIDKKIPELDLSKDQYQVLKTNNESPDRITTQWQYLISTGIIYKLSNRINMSAEPLFRYHISPAYERNSVKTKHPYSFGLRMGLLINL